MRRFLWIAMIFGGGIAALMVAAIALHHQSLSMGPGLRQDLKTTVKELRTAFGTWEYEQVTQYTSDMSRRAFQQIFDNAHGGDPYRTRMFAGALASMDAFPSVRFRDVKPEQVDVSYEAWDGTSGTKPETSFIPRGEGWFLRRAQFPVTSTDKNGLSPLVFHEGDNLSLEEGVEKLFDTLTTGSLEDFRSLMMLEPAVEKSEVVRLLDDIRAQVLSCRASRLKKLLPRLGPLPRGVRWFRILVVAEIDEKKLWLDMEVVPGEVVRFRSFRSGLIKEPVPPTRPPVRPPAAVPGPQGVAPPETETPP